MAAGDRDTLFDNLPDPTARTGGWWDYLFGEPTRRALQPQSRGALLGMGAYQNMPDANSSITDQRSAPIDLATEMRKEYPVTRNYAPSMAASPRQAWSDSMLDAAPMMDQGFAVDPSDPYQASFKQNWRPRATGQAPYNPFNAAPLPDGDRRFGTDAMGPNLPRGPTGAGDDPEMPYMGAHLPIAPGDPGWTPPPSPSGPHTRNAVTGDPARPGYSNPMMPMNLNSPFAPPQPPSQPSYQQLINFLQSRQGGAS